jgi:hypothetical protein
MTFYCIASTKRKKHAELLKTACDKYNLNFILIDPQSFNYDFTCPKDSILFRTSNYKDHFAREIEIFLISQGVTTFYSSFEKAKFSYVNGIIEHALHSQNNIPIPKSAVYNGQGIDDLEDIVKNKLADFPIVLKISGQSEGIGVIKIESLESLVSVLDVIKNNGQIIILKEMVKIKPPVFSYRSIVIGNKVVFSYKNQSITSKDFRSNADQNKRNRTIVDVAENDQQQIVRAVNVLGTELGAVDFAYNEKGELKIFEVNFPFNFLPIVEDLNFPIHELLVDYLVNKANKQNDY